MAALTEDQAAVYDRQLRVWGVDVQNRLTSAKVLVIGGNGVAAEAAKNLTLAGVGSITLLSNELCVSASPCNFLIPADAPDDATVSGASARTLQAMNPLIQVEASPAVTFQAQSMQGFDVVIACGLSLQQAVDLDAQCSATGARVFVADIHGPSSYVFANLHRHTYTVKDKPGETTLQYCSLAQALAHPLSLTTIRTHPLFGVLKVSHAFECEHGRPAAADDVAALRALAVTVQQQESLSDISTNPIKAVKGAPGVNAELLEGWASDAMECAPVSAILGGVIANNVIRVVSRVNAPLRNFFFYGLHDGMGVIEKLLGQ